MRYKINSTGAAIIADQAFMDAQHPNDYTLIPDAPAPTPVWENYIDLGPFYDRFSTAKMAVLTSPDAGVQAIIGDCNIRKWIDLDQADVASSIAYIASKVGALTPAIQAAILAKPVDQKDNFALRKTYFS